MKRYGQRHAHGIQYPRLQCCCILIDLPSYVHVPLSRRHKVGLVANILPGPGQQNNNNAISKWQKKVPQSSGHAWRRAGHLPAWILHAGNCDSAACAPQPSRKMERLDATVQGDRCSVFGGLFGLKFEQLKIGSSVVRFILRKSKTLLQELGHAISIQKDVRNQPDYWAIEPSFQPPSPSALFVTARGESISCMKQATVITLLCSLSLLRGNRTSTIGKEQ